MGRKVQRSLNHEEAVHRKITTQPEAAPSEEEFLSAQAQITNQSSQHTDAPQLHQNHFLRMQSMIGNAAVQRLLLKRTNATPAAPQIQRGWFDDEEEATETAAEDSSDGGSWWGGGEEESTPTQTEDSSDSGSSGWEEATETEDPGDAWYEEEKPTKDEGGSWWDELWDNDEEEESKGEEDDEGSWWDELWDDEEEGEAEDQEVLVETEEFVSSETGSLPDEHVHVAQIFPGEGLEESDTAVAAPAVGFSDGGRVGTAVYDNKPVADDDERPHAFTDGGQTGTVKWAGGGGAGARGNQPIGSIQSQKPPVFEAKKTSSGAEASIRIGTGLLQVTRSWVGINAGDQGNGHFVTAGAAARINNHELLHVSNTQGHYMTHLDPLLTKVGNHWGGIGSVTGSDKADAIKNLKAAIDWKTAIKAFQKADTADNNAKGSVDTNDLASGTYPVNAGAGTVGGKKFKHRVRLPSEPNPP